MARVYLSPPHLAGREAELVAEAIESNWIAPLGPHVDAFEAELAAVAGVEHAVALSSGTAALHLALVVLGIGAGRRGRVLGLHVRREREPDRLHGRDAVLRRRGRGDVDDRPGAPRPRDRRAARCGRPGPRRDRGRPLRPVLRLRRAPRGLRAPRRRPRPGCRPSRSARRTAARPSGGQGALAAFSFNGNKIITTSGGGMLVSENRDWIEHARKLSTQAREPVAHYEHVEIGFNYRMSNLLAALGRAQLETLPERVAARRRIRDRYRELLDDVPGITFMPEAAYGTSNAWLTCIVVDPDAFGADREADPPRARGRGHRGAAALEADAPAAGLRVAPRRSAATSAARLFERGLCLPSGSALTDDDQDRVVATVLAARRT